MHQRRLGGVGGEQALERDEGARLELRRRLGQRLDDGRLGVAARRAAAREVRDLDRARPRHQLGRPPRRGARAPSSGAIAAVSPKRCAQEALERGERRRARPARRRHQHARARLRGERSAPSSSTSRVLPTPAGPVSATNATSPRERALDDRVSRSSCGLAPDEARRLRIARRLLDQIAIVEQLLVDVRELGAERRRHALGAAGSRTARRHRRRRAPQATHERGNGAAQRLHRCAPARLLFPQAGQFTAADPSIGKPPIKVA